jgi:hypothetical protein
MSLNEEVIMKKVYLKMFTLISILVLCYSFACAKTASKSAQLRGNSYNRAVEGDVFNLNAIGTTEKAYSLGVNKASVARYISNISVEEYRYSTLLSYKCMAGTVASGKSMNSGSITRSPEYISLRYVHKLKATSSEYAQDSLDSLTYTALQQTN